MECITKDLLLQIFAGLELDDLGRLRCVCRSWHSAIASQGFAKQWKNRDQVCCVLRAKDSIHREVWFPGSGARRSTGLNPGPRGCFSIGVSSSHGLVCGLLPDEGRYWSTPDTAWKFVVGNPLTNKWRRLPPIDIPCRPLCTMERIHLQADPSKGSYKLAITYSEVGSDYEVIYQARQYDSESRVWTSAVPFIGEHDGANTKIDGSVLGSAGLHYPPYFLMAYNPDSMAWSCHKHFAGDRDPTPLNESVYKEYKLLDSTALSGVLRWRGRNFMVTHSFSCVVLWELDTVAGEWKVLSSRRYKELYGGRPSRRNSDIQALLVGSTIVFSDRYGTLFECGHGHCTQLRIHTQLQRRAIGESREHLARESEEHVKNSAILPAPARSNSALTGKGASAPLSTDAQGLQHSTAEKHAQECGAAAEETLRGGFPAEGRALGRESGLNRSRDNQIQELEELLEGSSRLWAENQQLKKNLHNQEKKMEAVIARMEEEHEEAVYPREEDGRNSTRQGC
ncbi:hypothetical protein SELMODRAFT_422195 [Selaginella moellendorffii]|uniref:F-box domain-containing protein n=1 Tax=Selaginella moellendorffii TaxID=88036 RepID=D8SHN3_SELML|nr:hypothetical protein SELMODRAFT_422195 [Selaginella moellendorffii]